MHHLTFFWPPSGLSQPRPPDWQQPRPSLDPPPTRTSISAWRGQELWAGGWTCRAWRMTRRSTFWRWCSGTWSCARRKRIGWGERGSSHHHESLSVYTSEVTYAGWCEETWSLITWSWGDQRNWCPVNPVLPTPFPVDAGLTSTAAPMMQIICIFSHFGFHVANIHTLPADRKVLHVPAGN